MKRIDLNSIIIFVEVSKHLSFTQASISLNMEVSTVSTKIKALESQLGMKLFVRSTRKVSLTQAGSDYLDYCVKGLETIFKGGEIIKQQERKPSGLLRLTVPINSIELIMETLIVPFLEKYPKVNIELVQSQILPDLIGDNFDFSFVAQSKELKDSNLVARSIIKTPSVLIGSKEYLSKHAPINSIEDLSNLTQVGFTDLKNKAVDQQKIYWKNKTVDIPYRFKANGIHGVIMGIKKGLGVGIVPKFLLLDEIKHGEVEIINSNIQLSETNLYLVYPNKEGMPAAAQAFIDDAISWGKLSQKKLES